MVVALVATLFAIVGCKSDIPPVVPPNPYLTFYSDTEFTVTPGKNWSYYDTSNEFYNYDNSILECSTDNTNWVVLNRNSDLKQTAVKSGDKYYLYFRGTGINNLTFDGSSTFTSWALDGNNIYCSGNIENLLDYKAVLRGEHPKMADICFYLMFKNCTALVSAPTLPSNELSNYCYAYMFSHCTSLIQAPELPSTSLATGCYFKMFDGCTSLVTAPELPSTTLASSCYQCMFGNCTSLATAPELPATTLANYCYHQMFSGCTSLATAPELPATMLTNGCYYQMFYGCEKLNSVTCLATDINASGCLSNWLTGTAATGTFTKAKETTIWTVGGNVPTGWTIQEIQ